MDENNNPSVAPAPEGGESQQSQQPQQPGLPVEAPAETIAQPPAEAPTVENPFAGFTPPAAEPAAEPAAQPYAAPAAQPAMPYAAPSAQGAEAPAARSAEPYYAAPAAAQQPAQPYGYEGYQPTTSFGQAPADAYQQAGYQQGAYQPYGAAQQPPVPPTPPVQSMYPGYEPPSANQKRRWPWFLLGLALGLVIGMGGCASCVGIMALADYDDYDTYDYANDSYRYDYDNDYDYDYDSPYHTWPPEDSYGFQDGTDLDATAGLFSYDEILAVFEPEGIEPGKPGEGNVCAKGIYTVGPDGQIPAGLYYLEGSNEKLSHYYLFDGEGGRYNVDDSVQYFGNYYADLDEGDLIVFDPGEDVTMHPASPTSTNPTAPYNNGCYRVGIDIPAGSYTITAYTVGEGETDEDSAAYVMKDLDFDEDSIVDTQYVIPGGKQVVTVTDGQYLELFAATATPVAQG